MSHLRVRFQGVDYILTNGTLDEGPLATEDQYQHGHPSFAHLMPGGEIKRFGVVIGHVGDLEVGESIDQLPAAEGALYNLLFGAGWLGEEEGS